MKRFIKYIFVLLIIFLILVIGLQYFTNSIVRAKSDFKLSNNIRHVVLGNSHSGCAFNDSLIFNSKNLSSSGESYFYTYQKIKKVLCEYPKIETVFVEFSNIQINKNMDEWIWGNKYMSFRYPKFAPFMDFDDTVLLIKNNFEEFQNCFSISQKKNIGRIIQNNYDFSNEIGGYIYLVRNKTDSLISARHITTRREEVVEYNISKWNIYYLKKIIDLCEKNNKNIFLIRSPQHYYSAALKNEKTFLKIKDSLFSKIEFLDFNNFNLKNNEFGDFQHLNYLGARKFSLWFDSLLKDSLLIRDNKKQYIQKRIEEQCN